MGHLFLRALSRNVSAGGGYKSASGLRSMLQQLLQESAAERPTGTVVEH